MLKVFRGLRLFQGFEGSWRFFRFVTVSGFIGSLGFGDGLVSFDRDARQFSQFRSRHWLRALGFRWQCLVREFQGESEPSSMGVRKLMKFAGLSVFAVVIHLKQLSAPVNGGTCLKPQA